MMPGQNETSGATGATGALGAMGTVAAADGFTVITVRHISCTFGA